MQPPKNQYNLSQKSPTRKSGFVRFQNKSSKKFFFHYNDLNGKPILFSQAYSSKTHRDKGLQSVKRNATDKSKYAQASLEGYFFFTIKANNNRAIARSKNFENQEDLEAAIDQLIEVSTYIDIKRPKENLESTHHSKEPIRENRSRYRFNLTFRKNTEEAPLLGTIEFPLTKDKDIFEGLDLEVIKNFIASHLPPEEKPGKGQQYKMKSTGISTGLALKKEVEILAKGNITPKSVFDNHSAFDIRLQIKPEEAKSVLGKNYQASITAKALKTGISLQVCNYNGIIPPTGNIEFPVKMTNILDGPYRLIINIRISNSEKPSASQLISTDKIIQVCSKN